MIINKKKTSHNLVQRDHTKQVEMDQHFVKEKLYSPICTPYVSIGEQLANILVKCLPNHSFQKIIGKLGMDNIYSSAWGGLLMNLIEDTIKCTP